MSEPLTREERDALLRRLSDIDQRLYPPDEADEPDRRERARLEDLELATLGEYADRLPRIAMSRCPFTGRVLQRAFDPFGMDGPWWHKERTFTPDEPGAPPTFKVLLGAVSFGDREPEEATEDVLPGPDLPFVVPRLLQLPGMVAVVSRITMETGDQAYPIAYFSQEEIDPSQLHQFWGRSELWLNTVGGGDGWVVKNDPWDFELAPWIERGKLRWIVPGDGELEVLGGDPASCPYVGLSGDRLDQLVVDGERETRPTPSGEPPQPFELDEEAEEDEEEE